MTIVTMTVNGGPLDGKHEIDTSIDHSIQMANLNFAAMMYDLFRNVPIGSAQRGIVSTGKLNAMQHGNHGTWGIHDHRLVARTADTMEVDYIGPVEKGQPLPRS